MPTPACEPLPAPLPLPLLVVLLLTAAFPLRPPPWGDGDARLLLLPAPPDDDDAAAAAEGLAIVAPATCALGGGLEEPTAAVDATVGGWCASAAACDAAGCGRDAVIRVVGWDAGDVTAAVLDGEGGAAAGVCSSSCCTCVPCGDAGRGAACACCCCCP